jgi:hypothetical protein
VREPLDVYPTPGWCVDRLLEEVSLPGGHWCEPCAGEGAIIRAVGAQRDDITWSALELRTSCREALVETGALVHICDALEAPSWALRDRPIDVIVTNPPFALAEEFLTRALAAATHVAFLLRLDFLGSERRSTFLRRTAPDVRVLPNRPSFVRGKTDNCEYAWFLWQRERDRQEGRVSVLPTTPREVRLPRREVLHVL